MIDISIIIPAYREEKVIGAVDAPRRLCSWSWPWWSSWWASSQSRTPSFATTAAKTEI